MARKLITVVETNEFLRASKGILTRSQADDLINVLANEPERGDLIKGTAGLRKIRVARGGKGKSGGARVIYYFYNDSMPVFLLTVFAKARQADLTGTERSELAKVANSIRRTYGA